VATKVRSPRNALLGGAASPLAISASQLLANDTAENGLDRFPPFLYERSEGIIYLCLVVRAPSQVGLLSKPVEHVIVETNGDSSFA
jgi:hypothetical protein